jgi:hypothetical protein
VLALGAAAVTQLPLLEEAGELSPEERALVEDMERPRPTGPRPEPCRCERPMIFPDEAGEPVCSRCGREPQR